MTQQVQPRGSRVTVRPKKREEVLASGIVLPELGKETPEEGVVIAIGPGDRDRTTGAVVPVPDLAVGDRVLFQKYAGVEITVDGEALLVIAERDVLAVVA